MTPQEWWHIYEAKHGIKTQKVGSLTYDEHQDVVKLVEAIRDKNGTSRRD